MDATMFNYDPNANTDNGSCIPFYYGCMDSTALNYDDDANTDNGSCIYAIYGCNDPTAINYDPRVSILLVALLVTSILYLMSALLGL